MKSLLLMSVLIAALAIPAIAARDRNPRRGVKRMVLMLLAFNAAYLAYITLVHPFVFVPQQ
jgi:cytochrome c biogenesis factor